MLDLRRLQYLDAIHRYHSFTKASEELFVSQSSVSIAIKSLEKELEVKLIARTPKGIEFTPEGEELVVYARRILQECRQAEARMADLSASRSHMLRLGISPTLGLALQSFLHSDGFAKRFPNTSVYLDEGSMKDHIEKVKQEILDLSYNALPSDGDLSSLKLIPTAKARIFAILLPDHPLAKRPQICFEDLDGVEMVLLDEKAMIRDKVMERVEEAGIVPRIHSSHNQIFCMLNTIKMGNYIGFLNASDAYMSRYLRESGLAIRPLEPAVSFDVGFILKADRPIPRMVRELVALVQSSGGGEIA